MVEPQPDRNRSGSKPELPNLLLQILANLNPASIRDILVNGKIPYVIDTLRRGIFGFSREDLHTAGREIIYEDCVVGYVRGWTFNEIFPVFNPTVAFEQQGAYERAKDISNSFGKKRDWRSLAICGPTFSQFDQLLNNGLEITGENGKGKIDDHKGGIFFRDGQVGIFLPEEKDLLRREEDEMILIGTSLAFEVPSLEYNPVDTARRIIHEEGYPYSHTRHKGFLTFLPSGQIGYHVFSEYGEFFGREENVGNSVLCMLLEFEEGTRVCALEESALSLPWVSNGYEDRCPLYFVGR